MGAIMRIVSSSIIFSLILNLGADFWHVILVFICVLAFGLSHLFD